MLLTKVVFVIQFLSQVNYGTHNSHHSREDFLFEVRKGFQGGTLVENLILEHPDLDVLEVLQLGTGRPRAPHLLGPLLQLTGQLLHRLLPSPGFGKDTRV